MSQTGSKPVPPMGGIESENLSGPHQFMHSLEEITRMNAPAEVAKRIRANRLFNSGLAGHAKSVEKTGDPRVRIEWMSGEEWIALKKKEKKNKRKRRAY